MSIDLVYFPILFFANTPFNVCSNFLIYFKYSLINSILTVDIEELKPFKTIYIIGFEQYIIRKI